MNVSWKGRRPTIVIILYVVLGLIIHFSIWRLLLTYWYCYTVTNLFIIIETYINSLNSIWICLCSSLLRITIFSLLALNLRNLFKTFATLIIWSLLLLFMSISVIFFFLAKIANIWIFIIQLVATFSSFYNFSLTNFE